MRTVKIKLNGEQVPLLTSTFPELTSSLYNSEDEFIDVYDIDTTSPSQSLLMIEFRRTLNINFYNDKRDFTLNKRFTHHSSSDYSSPMFAEFSPIITNKNTNNNNDGILAVSLDPNINAEVLKQHDFPAFGPRLSELMRNIPRPFLQELSWIFPKFTLYNSEEVEKEIQPNNLENTPCSLSVEYPVSMLELLFTLEANSASLKKDPNKDNLYHLSFKYSNSIPARISVLIDSDLHITENIFRFDSTNTWIYDPLNPEIKPPAFIGEYNISFYCSTLMKRQYFFIIRFEAEPGRTEKLICCFPYSPTTDLSHECVPLVEYYQVNNLTFILTSIFTESHLSRNSIAISIPHDSQRADCKSEKSRLSLIKPSLTSVFSNLISIKSASSIASPALSVSSNNDNYQSCVICFTDERELQKENQSLIIIVPCRHPCICAGCAKKLIEEQQPFVRATCPICRTSIYF